MLRDLQQLTEIITILVVKMEEAQPAPMEDTIETAVKSEGVIYFYNGQRTPGAWATYVKAGKVVKAMQRDAKYEHAKKFARDYRQDIPCMHAVY